MLCSRIYLRVTNIILNSFFKNCQWHDKIEVESIILKYINSEINSSMDRIVRFENLNVIAVSLKNQINIEKRRFLEKSVAQTAFGSLPSRRSRKVAWNQKKIRPKRNFLREVMPVRSFATRTTQRPVPAFGKAPQLHFQCKDLVETPRNEWSHWSNHARMTEISPSKGDGRSSTF